MGSLNLCFVAALAWLSVPALTLAQGAPAAGNASLRGEGVWLQGLDWSQEDGAEPVARDPAAAQVVYAWNKQLAADYRREATSAADRELGRRRLTEAARRQYLADRETRLRTRPSPGDLLKGDALNVFLTDLADPIIPESAWSAARVALPADIAIRALAFQFVARSGARENAALTRNLIAPGRLDTSGQWPDVVPRDRLQAEIRAFETAFQTIRDQSQAGRLEMAAVLELDQALKALRTKVASVVPAERGFRAEALKFVDGLAGASKMFDASTLDFARELVADVSRHDATTLGQLLAFMRKYRLLFARADTAAGGEEMYARLYSLLKKQAEELHLDPQALPMALAAKADAPAGRTEGGTRLPTRFYYADDFTNPRSGWPLRENTGYEGGVYFVAPQNGWSAWNCPAPIRNESTLEVRGIVRSREPFTKGAVEVHVSSSTAPAPRGFSVRINNSGQLFLNPVPWEASPALRQADPAVGPIVHPSIKPSSAGNILVLHVRKRSVEIFVNSTRVCEPILFNYDLIPGTLALGSNDGPTTARAEFESVEIREFVPPDALLNQP